MSPAYDRFSHRFAQAIVLYTFGLIFLGGLVTSWNAGMAVPDWPLSFGSFNPHQWWKQEGVVLEHSHRLVAAFLGLLITILCARIWRNYWPILWAVLISGAVSAAAKPLGASKEMMSHLGIWGFAFVFAVFLLFMRGAARKANGLQWLAFATFVGVALQASFGGLRVTLETDGHVALATTLRVVHGCVAQAQLCLLVSLAALLSPRWQEAGASQPVAGAPRLLAWVAVGAIYCQLIFGAAMRHLHAGLAIPTFPAAQPSGSWLPIHGPYTDLNFLHTRVGALFVTALVLTLAIRLLRWPGLGRAVSARLPWLLLASVAVQVTLGIFVIWHLKPPTLTTFHVVNGAFLLAVTVLISLRLQRAASVQSAAAAADHHPLPTPTLA